MLELLTPSRAEQLAERISRLFSDLLGLDSDLAYELLGALCEKPGEKVVPKAYHEIWTTGDGRRVKIGEMAPEHLAHTLAVIMRMANEGKCWKVKSRGCLRSYPIKEDKLICIDSQVPFWPLHCSSGAARESNTGLKGFQKTKA